MSRNANYLWLMIVIPLFLAGCGDANVSFSFSEKGGLVVISDDDEISRGDLTIRIADFYPALPSGTEQVRITFDEVYVYSENEGWISLPLVQEPYTVDLLQHTDGLSGELVPPVALLPGLYTRILIGLTDAIIRVEGVDYPVEIPLQSLRTIVEFGFQVGYGDTVDLTVDFDLSQSMIVSGQNDYMLDPVLYISETQGMVAIFGEIAPATFDFYSSLDAVVIVTARGEEYTRLFVRRDDPVFIIHFLVPDQDYVISVDIDGNTRTLEYVEFVPWYELLPGTSFRLNEGNSI